MAQNYADLEREVRDLSPEERARLVNVILESLNVAEVGDVEADWAAEIERRVLAYERGEVQLVPAEEVFAKARAISGA